MFTSKLSQFIAHIAQKTGVSRDHAKAGIGIVLSAAQRQGSAFAAQVFEKLPGAYELAQEHSQSMGAATGVIARLIEQTPGGRTAVATQMIRSLQQAGFGNTAIGELLPLIGEYARTKLGIEGGLHIGDVFGAGLYQPRQREAA
jgi:hypothetical protein